MKDPESLVRHLPAKYRHDQIYAQREHLAADEKPIAKRRGVSIRTPIRKAEKRIHERVVRHRRFPLGEPVPKDARAIDQQVDCDGAGYDCSQEELHMPPLLLPFS